MFTYFTAHNNKSDYIKIHLSLTLLSYIISTFPVSLLEIDYIFLIITCIIVQEAFSFFQ